MVLSNQPEDNQLLQQDWGNEQGVAADEWGQPAAGNYEQQQPPAEDWNNYGNEQQAPQQYYGDYGQQPDHGYQQTAGFQHENVLDEWDQN